MFTLPFPVQDANALSGNDGLEGLPEWDLSDLYKSEDAPEFERDMTWLQTACADFGIIMSYKNAAAAGVSGARKVTL